MVSVSSIIKKTDDYSNATGYWAYNSQTNIDQCVGFRFIEKEIFSSD